MIWELMKAQRTGVYPDLRTKYIADAFKNTSSTITEMSGELPLAFVTTGLPLTNYKAYGNAVQAATPSPDNPVEVQAVGEKTGNLFDKDNATVHRAFVNANDMWLSVSYDKSSSVRISVKPDTIYSLSIDTPIPIFRIYESSLDNPSPTVNGTAVSRVIRGVDINKYTFTTSSTTKYIVFQGSGDNFESWINSLMLNEGETALPYEQYGYKIPFTTAAEDGTESITTTAYIKQPLYKIGDYADTLCYAEQKVERYIKEIVLTGEENITHHKTFSGYVSVRIPIIGYTLHNSQLFCTHSQQISFPDLFNGTKIGIAVHNVQDLDYVILAVDGLNSKDDYKNWLAEQYAAGTPVKVWYVLATPETESVELPKLPTLDGVTVIDAATTIKPSKMDIKYTGHRLLMFARRDN